MQTDSYYCKMPFQILTGQWSKLYTHKFRIGYDQFITNSSTRLSFNIVTLPRGVEVIGAKIFLTEKFEAPSLSLCNCYLIADTNLSLSGEASRTPAILNLMQTVTDYSGTIGTQEIPTNRQLNPTDFYTRLITNSISGGAQFTAGEIEVWLITMKLP